MIAHQCAEMLSGDHLGLARLILEQQNAVTGLGVEAAVAQEMQDVVFLPEQLPLEGVDRRGGQAVDRHHPARFQVVQRRFEVGPFALDIQGRVPRRTGDHRPHAQPWLALLATRRFGQVG